MRVIDEWESDLYLHRIATDGRLAWYECLLKEANDLTWVSQADIDILMLDRIIKLATRVKELEAMK